MGYNMVVKVMARRCATTEEVKIAVIIRYFWFLKVKQSLKMGSDFKIIDRNTQNADQVPAI